MSSSSSSSSSCAPPPPPSTKRRDQLLHIEQRVQSKWESSRLFHSSPSSSSREKYFATFPFPYMNGALHLGHAFTLAKVDFQCHFQRLQGKEVLFPFAFHCTGMPIAACADRLKREISTFGLPPHFPSAEEEDEEQRGDGGGGDAENEEETSRDDNDEAMLKKGREKVQQREKEGLARETLGSVDPLSPSQAVAEVIAQAAQTKVDKKRKGKAKLAKKASKHVYQWNILGEMGVPEDEISRFADPYYWLHYFPPIAVADLKAFGLSADWRRSFVTTNINPYYDAFIRWQFNTLRRRQKIEFGARLSIFSPVDDQTCADHDRSEGEGVGISDYTLIKLNLLPPYPSVLTALLQNLPASSKRQVYLPAATLRPETMYGQTNCFLLPEGSYGVFDINDETVFICSERSALNMSYQGMTRNRGQVDRLGSVAGQSLMGCAVKAPLATFDKVYVLPLTTIKMDKGTGVVTSVPSDAPDDYAALMDLKRKEPFRAKFGIKAEHVDFDVVPIIDIPGLGTQAAADLCVQENVASQNDRVKLELIKDKCYKEGFAKGIMLVGEYKGMRVSEAKPKIKQWLIDVGMALAYSEPEARVVSRSGCECVVAFSDQWYLKYGEQEWQSRVKTHVQDTLETYNPLAKKAFLEVLDWLHHWACSRSYGLGTFLPWDQQYVIESLSDSTIYMAYYTISHLLQGGVESNNIEGNKVGPAEITAEQMSDAVFDYIFLKDEQPDVPVGCTISKEKLDSLRHEFEFWYPLDLRVSGKDLIGNHLSFSLYTHAAIWERDSSKWPRSFFTNGHVTIDAKKMSKSEGTFITLRGAIAEYSSDATRFALADAGDTLEDANFEKKGANAAILKLTREIGWLEEFMESAAKAKADRIGDFTFFDRVFDNELSQCVHAAKEAYLHLQYRAAVKASFHELTAARDNYRLNVEVMHIDLIRKYWRLAALLLSPVCPHCSQHLWELSGASVQTAFITQSRWPEVPPVDLLVTRQSMYLRDVNAAAKKAYADQLARLAKTRLRLIKSDLKSASAHVDTSGLSHCIVLTAATYPSYQQDVLCQMAHLYLGKVEMPTRKAVTDMVRATHGKDKKMMEQCNKFAGSVLDDFLVRGEAALELNSPFDEAELIRSQWSIVLREIPVDAANATVKEISSLSQSTDPEIIALVAKALPGRPTILFHGGNVQTN